MGSYPTGARGFATLDPRHPAAWGICDRCGQRYDLRDLTFQYEWAGVGLQNLRILVCRRKCLDIPNEQLRAYAVPADPLPVRNPRPDFSDMGGPIIVTTVAATSSPLLPASVARNYMALEMPASFGVSINPTGGDASPGAMGASFFAPGSAINLLGTAAQSAMTYWCAVAGLQLVVQIDNDAG